ncbi:MAG: response regulator, partial [bacterium]|nr:response regulator [bacterium]
MEVITANSKEVTKCSVLVVDDDVKYLLAISRILKTQGYDIFKAKCGQEALDILDKSRPDLIVLDIQLPDIDGYELARRLNENPETKDIPVMFLTGSSEVLDILTGFQTGAVDYISKPVNYLELLARLETQVKLKQRRDKIISMNKQLQEEIQERKRVEQALIEKTHQLEQLNKFLETRVKEEVEKRRSH